MQLPSVYVAFGYDDVYGHPERVKRSLCPTFARCRTRTGLGPNSKAEIGLGRVIPLERLREEWRSPFKKFLAHPASPLGRFFSGLRLQTDAFSRHLVSPLGRSLWATV
ncbi:hypothetical protein Prudu_017167 [Prunus dulcis]|uniref:Uncharacterized protein n=1 Tax=Prunus dulcis TaxID=3755 RepID=A0A4Y1RMZ7_PRUDU|nr:hypothetical protein Prudu_017167 [Prunus dulcis]